MTHAPMRGLTFVELLVVLGIMVVVTTIVMTGQSQFNQSLLLTDTAYTVALSLREAQSLGISSRGVGGVYNFGYGVNFNYGSQNKYTIYADTASTAATPSYCPVLTAAVGTPEAKGGNCLYDGTSEVVQTYTFNRGFKVTEFCGKDTSGTRRCAANGGISSLDVLYLRPNTQAIITGMAAGTAVQMTCAEITLTSPTGTNVSRVIRVNQLGEISVGQTCS